MSATKPSLRRLLHKSVGVCAHLQICTLIIIFQKKKKKATWYNGTLCCLPTQASGMQPFFLCQLKLIKLHCAAQCETIMSCPWRTCAHTRAAKCKSQFKYCTRRGTPFFGLCYKLRREYFNCYGKLPCIWFRLSVPVRRRSILHHLDNQKLK